MDIQKLSLDTYTAFQNQAERADSLRVAPPPRRSDEPAGVTTANSDATTNNPVENSGLERFSAMLQQELQNSATEWTDGLGRENRINDIAEQIRNGTYKVDALATASRLNDLELLLR